VRYDDSTNHFTVQAVGGGCEERVRFLARFLCRLERLCRETDRLLP
jgi:hypothetical protein